MSAAPASVIEAALRERAPEACLRVLWLDAPVVPPLRGARALRGVFTLPHARVATLRHWRDSHEWTAEHAGERWDVVLHEASTWARLLMKAHGGSVAIASRAPAFARNIPPASPLASPRPSSRAPTARVKNALKNK